MIHDYLQEKINTSKETLRVAASISKEYYHKPLIVTYSGGKDSDVMAQLAVECLAPDDFEVMNSHTTVDAPETVYYIRDKFKEFEAQGIKTTIHYPHYEDGRFKSMWSLIVDREIPPTRLARYCCFELKETSTPNRFVATGVRAAESVKRRGRDLFTTRGKNKSEYLMYSIDHIKEVFQDDRQRRENENVPANEVGVYDCLFVKKAKENDDLICNPIYQWTDTEVWEFIHDRGMKYNPLYDKGYTRVGCIGCPLSSDQVKELEMYPKYKQNYINAFQRMMDKRIAKGKRNKSDYGRDWKDGKSVYKWWVNDTSIEGQMDIFDFMKEGE